jgi:hypothetical protein
VSDYTTARAQFIKTKRAEVRLRYTLMADAEIAASLSAWKLDFEKRARENAPQVLDLRSELRRLTDGSDV